MTPAPPVVVRDNRLVNAFTLPDGEIVVMRGLIDAAQDGDEVSGVLAHEMGHVQHRDPAREMLRRIGLNMTARSLGWGGNLAGALTGLSYGRRAEARADDAALVTLSRAGLRGCRRSCRTIRGRGRGLKGCGGRLWGQPRLMRRRGRRSGVCARPKK